MNIALMAHDEKKYTYRNRLRNAATIPPQEFEKRILEIR